MIKTSSSNMVVKGMMTAADDENDAVASPASPSKKVKKKKSLSKKKLVEEDEGEDGGAQSGIDTTDDEAAVATEKKKKKKKEKSKKDDSSTADDSHVNGVVVETADDDEPSSPSRKTKKKKVKSTTTEEVEEPLLNENGTTKEKKKKKKSSSITSKTADTSDDEDKGSSSKRDKKKAETDAGDDGEEEEEQGRDQTKEKKKKKKEKVEVPASPKKLERKKSIRSSSKCLSSKEDNDDDDKRDKKTSLKKTKKPNSSSSSCSSTTTPRRKSSSVKNRKGSANFLMFKDMECQEEFQKVRLAGFLRELHKLATEDLKVKVRRSVSLDSTEMAKQMNLNNLSRQTSAPVVQSTTTSTTSTTPTCSSPRRGIRRTTSAITTRQQQLQQQTKRNISVVNGLISLRTIPDLLTLTPVEASEIINALHAENGKFDDNSLIALIRASTNLLSKEDTVVDLRPLQPKQLTVVGDIHGSLTCLMNVLRLVNMTDVTENVISGSENTRVVVFDGDFVDRGRHSLEVLSTLLLLKLSHPTHVVLLRGNHEDIMTASTYGFKDEIEEKYGYDIAEDIWYECGMLFAAFPLCARTNRAVVMHGGIPTNNLDLDAVNRITSHTRCQLKTVVDPYDEDEELVQGILWSDPAEEDGLYPNDRGAGYQFGPDVTRAFLDRHDLKYIIRGHEPFESGSNYQDIGDGRGVITVFSTANYPDGEGTNDGAILHVNEETGDFETFEFKFNDRVVCETQTYVTFLRPLVDDKKRKLQKAFKSVQNSEGFVTCEQWAEIVAEQFDLHDVPWLELQPELAPTTQPDGADVDWQVFLDTFSTRIPKTELLEEDQLSLLRQHKEKFLKIFQVLDTDGSGTISLAEFTSGIDILNEQIPGDQKMKNADQLFPVFDIDGDGEISIEEFATALKESAALKGVTDSLSTKQVETLQENHKILLSAFKYLDTDHSGAIDRDEFQTGIDLLNKRLPERSKLGDPQELFNLLDEDGNGEIDLNEFNQLFRCI